MHNPFSGLTGRHGRFTPALPLAAVLAGASLFGCARFHDRPLSAVKAADSFQARSLTDAGLRSFLETNHAGGEWPRRSWDFPALSLAAFYFHPDLAVARAQLAGAKALGVTARQSPNPTAYLTPTYDTTSLPPWIPGIYFDVPIETMGKRGYRMAQAAHLSNAARLNLVSVAWQVRSRLHKNLLALYAAVESEALLEKQADLQSESVRLLQAQLDAGAVSPFEVVQSRIALQQTRFALHDAEKQAAVARLQVAESLGVPSPALDGVTFDFDQFKRLPGDIPDTAARRQALLNRPDILGALAEYAATQSALQLEIARQYPDVHLQPGYMLDQTDNKWSLGLSVELPVVNQNQGPIAEAAARRAECAAKFNALQARVLSEIEQAVAGYRASVKKAVAAESLNRELESQLRVAREMQEAGEISRVELGQRQLELSAAAMDRLNALIGAQDALASLEDALQSPAFSGEAPERLRQPTAENDISSLPKSRDTRDLKDLKD